MNEPRKIYGFPQDSGGRDDAVAAGEALRATAESMSRHVQASDDGAPLRGESRGSSPASLARGDFGVVFDGKIILDSVTLLG
jgi:hypothetical protein